MSNSLLLKLPRILLVTLAVLVAELRCQTKKDSSEAATSCMTDIGRSTGNIHFEPFFPFVVKRRHKTNTQEFVQKLANMHLCAECDSPSLAAVLPGLSRGLNHPAQEVKRTCCLIVDNMCKIVEDPAAVIPILSKFEPFVKATCKEMSNPDARNIAERTLKLWHPWQRAWKLALRVGRLVREASSNYLLPDQSFLVPLQLLLWPCAPPHRKPPPEGWESIVGSLGAAVCQLRGA